MNTIEIGAGGLALGYLLVLIPVALAFWLAVGIVRDILVAVMRMTIQLLLVGFYLEIVFRLNQWWLNMLWLLIMILAADVSVIRGCRLRLRRFVGPMFLGLLLGTLIPLLFFIGVMLRRPQLTDAPVFIPIAGMILGNCLRANIVGLAGFYHAIRRGEKAFLHALSQGARLSEAAHPYLQDAYRAALAPTIEFIASVGIVVLPGMMTGVILGGASPMTAIKYQIAIMISILAGTAITVFLVARLTMRSSFTPWGVLDPGIFRV